MPNGAIMLGSMAWVLNVMNNGPVSIGTVINIAFVAMVVAIAAPPIPGSAFAVMPILFSACGTDLSTMPLAVIVASTVGYLLPAMNGFCLQQELLMSAWKSNMIEKESTFLSSLSIFLNSHQKAVADLIYACRHIASEYFDWKHHSEQGVV